LFAMPCAPWRSFAGGTRSRIENSKAERIKTARVQSPPNDHDYRLDSRAMPTAPGSGSIRHVTRGMTLASASVDNASVVMGCGEMRSPC
jgi:hypothetical protein